MCKKCDLIADIQKLHEEVGVRMTQMQLELQQGNEAEAQRCEDIILGNTAQMCKNFREIAKIVSEKPRVN